VTLGSGKRLTVDIVYAGPDNSRRITVTTFSRPFYVMNDPEPEHIKLTLPSGEVRTAERIAGSSQSHSFDDLEPGVYALEIDDPRYLPWSSPAVRPGADVDAHLQGSAVLVLEVVDGEGRALDEFHTRVEFRNVNFSPKEFEVLAILGRLEGMFPGDYTLHVRAGELLGAAEVDGLAAGETRHVRVSVGAGRIVSGRVQHRDGSPVVLEDVRLLLPAEQEDSPTSPIQTKDMSVSGDGTSRYRREFASVPSDDDGRFRFAVARAGSYVVHVAADGSETSSDVFELTDSGSEELVLVLPRGGRVRGSLRGPEGESCTGFRV